MVASLLRFTSSFLLIVTCSGVILNSLLLYIILCHTKHSIGFYKYLMAAFTFYELLYCFVLLLVMPLHVVGYHSWIAFSFNGVLSSTFLATEITSFYCSLYAAWLGFVLVNYIYRYIVLCRHHWLHYISQRIWLKLILFLLFAIFISGTIFCAYYSCRIHHPTQEYLEYIESEFHIETQNLTYIMVRIQFMLHLPPNTCLVLYESVQIGEEKLHDDPVTGEIEGSGIIAIVVHFVFLALWLIVITFCSVKMFIRIKLLQTATENIRENVVLEKQLFLVLFLQTIIPLVFCGIPSIIHFTFPFWSNNAFFTPVSPLFSTISSLPKMLDPLVSLLFIRTYRHALQKILHMETSSTNVNPVSRTADGHPDPSRL